MAESSENKPVENKLVDLKKFFTPEGGSMSTSEFTAEWNQLSDEEKAWFKSQPLE